VQSISGSIEASLPETRPSWQADSSGQSNALAAECGAESMKPSVRDLEQALSIRLQINVLEKRLAAVL